MLWVLVLRTHEDDFSQQESERYARRCENPPLAETWVVRTWFPRLRAACGRRRSPARGPSCCPWSPAVRAGSPRARRAAPPPRVSASRSPPPALARGLPWRGAARRSRAPAAGSAASTTIIIIIISGCWYDAVMQNCQQLEPIRQCKPQPGKPFSIHSNSTVYIYTVVLNCILKSCSPFHCYLIHPTLDRYRSLKLSVLRP